MKINKDQINKLQRVQQNLAAAKREQASLPKALMTATTQVAFIHKRISELPFEIEAWEKQVELLGGSESKLIKAQRLEARIKKARAQLVELQSE
jgi:hypothetical protein